MAMRIDVESPKFNFFMKENIYQIFTFLDYIFYNKFYLKLRTIKLQSIKSDRSLFYPNQFFNKNTNYQTLNNNQLKRI